MCDGCGCSFELEQRLLRCVNCGGDHVITGCPNWEPRLQPEPKDEDAIDPFLMVITDVDEESQVVSLHSVFDWEPPCEMKWFYGAIGPCDNILDKVGETYRVTIEKLP